RVKNETNDIKKVKLASIFVGQSKKAKNVKLAPLSNDSAVNTDSDNDDIDDPDLKSTDIEETNPDLKYTHKEEEDYEFNDKFNDSTGSSYCGAAFKVSVDPLFKKVLEMAPKCLDANLVAMVDQYGEQSWKEVAKHEGHILDPTKERAFPYHDLSRKKLPQTRSVIYAKTMVDQRKQEDLEQLLSNGDTEEFLEYLKIGSTGKFFTRVNDPKSVYSCSGGKFVKVLDLDKIPLDLDKDLGRTLFAFLKAAMEADDVPLPFKVFCKIFLERDGYRLGLKRVGVRLLVEIGAFTAFGAKRGNSRELCMFDPKKWKAWNDKAQEICDLVYGIWKKSCGTADLSSLDELIVFLASWQTGHADRGGISSKQSLTNTIAGRELDYKKIDTLPFPAKPEGTTVEEMFSEDFSKEKLKQGSDKCNHELKSLPPGQTAIMDQNNLCCGPGGLDKRVVNDFRYTPEANIMNGELRVYVNMKTMTMVLVMKPLGYALDSRPFVTTHRRSLRLVMADALYRFSCKVRGVPYDEEKNPLVSNYVLQLCQHGLKLGQRVPVTVAKDVVTPDTIFACRSNKLGKTPEDDPDYPVAYRNRNEINGVYDKTRKSERRADKEVYQFALNICAGFEGTISPIPSPSIVALHGTIVRILTKDGKNLSDRMPKFYRHLETKDPMLKAALVSYEESTKENEGNRNASAATNDEKDLNATMFEEIIKLCPSREKGGKGQFYVRVEAANVDTSVTEYVPEKHKGLPRFEVCYGTVHKHFSNVSKNKDRSQSKTAHFKADTPPADMKVGGDRDIDGTWKRMKVYWASGVVSTL
ncbi:MAG: hypothetical protein SGILL_004166, partial [Bacillariaceae sp.]